MICGSSRDILSFASVLIFFTYSYTYVSPHIQKVFNSCRMIEVNANGPNGRDWADGTITSISVKEKVKILIITGFRSG